MQSGKRSAGGRQDAPAFTSAQVFALVFGLFLGLCLWKFGNPVILDHKIDLPANLSELWEYAWPLHWANWILSPLVLAGVILVFRQKPAWPRPRWLIWLPLAWLGWQFLSAGHTEDAYLTTVTLWQFFGCVACYFLGVTLFAGRQARICLLAGVLVALIFNLIQAVDQRLFEFPVNYQMMVQGERCGWTNFPPETIAEMKNEGIIIHTNSVDIANPVILTKFAKGRVYGTLVYPNALAGAILMLLPAAWVLLFSSARALKPPIRFAAIALGVFLGGAAFFWTGSKLGWLLGIVVGGLFLLRRPWPKKLKLAATAAIMVLGMVVFAIRFHGYFAAGATSVGARFDYWRAALQTTANQPWFGTGPGAFQHPYARLKSPDAEMARLTHNDYLEQFCDSGVVGGLAYFAWIALTLAALAKRMWSSEDLFTFALFAGLLAWFAQGFGEFGLYIPALAWTAFTLLGSLIGREIIKFDKKSVNE